MHGSSALTLHTHREVYFGRHVHMQLVQLLVHLPLPQVQALCSPQVQVGSQGWAGGGLEKEQYTREITWSEAGYEKRRIMKGQSCTLRQAHKRLLSRLPQAAQKRVSLEVYAGQVRKHHRKLGCCHKVPSKLQMLACTHTQIRICQHTKCHRNCGHVSSTKTDGSPASVQNRKNL